MMRTRPTLLGLLVLLCLCGCTLPRVIVLNDPLDARAHNDLGVSYQQHRESDLAIREYDRAAKLDPQWARPLINRGNALAERGEWWQAQKSYHLALRREPGNAEAMNNLAWVLLQTEEAGEALAWAEKAVAADPREPAYLDTLAEIRIVRHDYTGASRIVDRALLLNPDPQLRHGFEQKRALLDALNPLP